MLCYIYIYDMIFITIFYNHTELIFSRRASASHWKIMEARLPTFVVNFMKMSRNP